MFSDSMMLGGGRKAAFSIANSVRMDGVADYFTRTPSTVGNRKTWTFSAWVKRSSLVDGSYTLLNAGTSSAAFTGFSWDNGTYANHLTFYCNATGANLRCSMLSRDVAAWYHLCLAVDTDLPDVQASDRVRIYVNGQRVTAFDLANYPARSTATHVNAAELHQIGKRIGTSEYLDGYVASPILVDGVALDPSHFGETDPVTGSWRPKRYVGPGNLPVYGADVTAGKTVSVSPDLVIDGTNLAPFAIDDNPSTKIATNNAFTANTSRIIIDLGAGGDKAIARITTNQESNYVWTAGKLQYSDDGTSWSDAGSFNPSNSTSTQAFDFPDSGAHRYWALMPTANAYGGSGYGLRFNEIELIERLDSASNFGTNGFHLDFADVTDLGKDVSGSFKNWLPVSLGAADVVADTPTNNYATINPLNMQSGLVLSNGNTSANGSTAVRWWRSSLAMSGGKWYFEMKANSANNSYCGIGIEPVVVTRNDGLNQYPGGSEGGADGYGLYTMASPPNQGIRHAHNGVYTDIADAGFNNASVMKVAVDLDAKMLWLGYDNIWIGGGDPAQGTSPTYTLSAQVSDWVMMGCAYNEVTCYFGASGFNLTVPAGFKSLCTANLPKPVIQAPSKHMDVVTYTGNGTARAISGLGFRPDLVWVKSRSSGSAGHTLFDVIRGPGKILSSSASSAELTQYPDTLTSFNPDGFGLGIDVTAGTINVVGQSYVAWCWKAGGAPVANTVGSIASMVSANPTAGFSIVTWTGTGVMGSIGHGLGNTPKLIITKQRAPNESNWSVWAPGLSFSQYLYLDSTAGTVGDWVWLSGVDASLISVGSNSANWAAMNQSGSTYVAYCWAEVPGFSKFGSYTGNGSSDGPFVHCGFRPRLVLAKRTDATGSWRIVDTARDPYNEAVKSLYPNSIGAEDPSDGFADFTATGFKIRRAVYTGTYIYAAFAEAPLGGAKTVPAKAR